MKEPPLLMTPENAQKTHDRIKTQTRRIVKFNAAGRVELKGHQWHRYDPDAVKACPYGAVGDRLWIRENGWERPERTPQMLRDGADTWERYYFDALLDPGEAEELKGYGFKRRPSIHMPRWACRTVVEIMEVRLDRLQAITQLDAFEEGCEGPDHKGNFFWLWLSIRGVGSWNRNPFCWVMSFRKVDDA